MKKYFAVSIISTLVFVFGFISLYSLGFSAKNISPELSIASISPFGNKSGKAIAASCGYGNDGHAAEDYGGCSTTIDCGGVAVGKNGTSLCGGGCTPSDYNCPYVEPQPAPTCGNGATNYPDCNNNVCGNGAVNFPYCNGCNLYQVFFNGSCVDCANGGCTNATCNNGATNPPYCSDPPCNATDSCGVVKSARINPATGLCAIVDAAACSKNNSCGTTFNGFQCAGGCTAAPNNDDCITNFKLSSTNVSPNGSVEFSWKTKPGVGSKCGFVDLTTPTARQIPGLQNLDPNTDRARISNIQTTTRFCLVCQFYSLINNAALGEVAVHQWVKVIRIGEN